MAAGAFAWNVTAQAPVFLQICDKPRPRSFKLYSNNIKPSVCRVAHLARVGIGPVMPDHPSTNVHIDPADHRLSDALSLALDDVVVTFACNDRFAPYLSVALQSLLDHTSPARTYDIVVLSIGIESSERARLRSQFDAHPNCHIGFVEVAEALQGRILPVHGHFKPEIYLRLLAPELLAPLEKTLYLDCDLLVCADVAELFDTDVSGYLLAVALDADMAGQVSGYHEGTRVYLAETLGLDDPLNYFQSGMLVLNLAEFRRTQPTNDLLELACSRHWQWPDQDVLNVVAQNHWREVDLAWNVVTDWAGIRRSRIIGSAPPDVRARYEEARAHPAIVHYAGPDMRPWLYPNVDFGEAWWNVARRTPFIDEITTRLDRSRRTLAGVLKRAQVWFLYRVVMDGFDALCPPGSSRRRSMLKAIRHVSGGLVV